MAVCLISIVRDVSRVTILDKSSKSSLTSRLLMTYRIYSVVSTWLLMLKLTKPI